MHARSCEQVKVETRSFPNLLVATLAILPSKSLIPSAPFSSTNASIAGLARDLVGRAVTTVSKHGWSGITNGQLLESAEKEFDVFVTVDRKLGAQQDLKKFRIPVILIRARTKSTGTHSSARSRTARKVIRSCRRRTDYRRHMIRLFPQPLQRSND